MNLKLAILDALDRLGTSSLPPRYPSVAIEVAPDRLTAIRLGSDRKGGKRTIAAFDNRPLPAGAIEVSLTKPNVVDAAPIKEALHALFVKLRPKDHHVSILLPDDVARVSLLPFGALPKTRRELHELVRFRMAKSLPFRPEDAVMDLMVLGGATRPGTASASVLAAFVHRAVVEQYEALFVECGYWPGLVTLSTFELFNLFRPLFLSRRVPDKDSLVLNVTRQYLSVVILRDSHIIFYRCKPHLGDANGDSLSDVRREIYTSLAFYQEKLLGRGIGKVFLRCSGLPLQPIRDAVGAETGGEAEDLDPLAIVPLNGSPALTGEEASLAAPAIGAAAGRAT